ncbi:MAG TPA: NAD-dependent epimerase/dehydratase family protein [Longimicrobiales bacterium]|nr:NAD-dependent epimerase/dehydratase family protein [Longimicrobiales bacterium]
MKRVLITGGAGFIGSHLADELLDRGYAVRVLDVLDEQVHGSTGERPDYLHGDVELVVGDVADPAAVRYCLDDVDAVVHLAARVGVGQSMYEAASYTHVNSLGTAVLLEELRARPVERLVVASSMSVYGEGLYVDADGAFRCDARRTREQLERRAWEPCDTAGRPLTALPTPEWKQPDLSSVYAVTKYDQERLCLLMGEAYGIPIVALRLFNVYGTRQALSNPYTGVLAIFASRLLNERRPLVFEDGSQRRDFVHVRDVARAFRLALEKPDADGQTLNVGSGTSYRVREVGERLAQVMGTEIAPDITGEFRVGDIRHCWADPARARDVLGFEASVDFDEGLAELAAWLEGRSALDRVDHAKAQLAERGLTL